MRHKYACKTCDASGNGGNIEIAIKTPQSIDRGLPEPRLLAYVVVSKLGDYLPLYRLEKIFDRHGVDIARSTMCAWTNTLLAICMKARRLPPLLARVGIRPLRHVEAGEARGGFAGTSGMMHQWLPFCLIPTTWRPKFDVTFSAPS